MPRIFQVGQAVAEKGLRLTTQVVSYSRAVARWMAAGEPIRSPEAQAEILAICKACPNYKPHKKPGLAGSCGLCGCRLNIGAAPSRSKIAMGTESCPDKPPRWTAMQIDQPPAEAPPKQPVTSLGGFQGEPAEAPQIVSKPLGRKEARRARIEARNARRANELIEAAKFPEVSPTLSRKERRRQRQVRKLERQMRINKRKAEEIAMGGEKPPREPVTDCDDPLAVYDAKGSSIGHAMRGLWKGQSAFFVCGGPSLKTIDLSFLRERGIVSLGINNVAGYAPVRAWTFSDPACKFHHGIFFDPAIIKFVPLPKLGERVRAKLDDGTFRWTQYEVRDCPSVFGYNRFTKFNAETFLTTAEASWGQSEKHKEKGKPTTLSTFLLGLRLLHYLGVRRVYLLGVDFKMDADNHYAFGQNRHEGALASNTNAYRVVSGMCTELRPVLEAAGFEVYQTNRHSGLRVFDYIPLDAAIEDCRGVVPREPWSPESFAGWYEKPKLDEEGPGTDDRGED